MSLDLSFPDASEFDDLEINFDTTDSEQQLDFGNSDHEHSSDNDSNNESDSESSEDEDEDSNLSTSSFSVPELSEMEIERLTIIPSQEKAKEKQKRNNELREEFREWEKTRKEKTETKKIEQEDKEKKKKKQTKPKSKPKWVRVTKQNKEDAVTKHKYHLLLWLAHHKFVYSFIKSEEIQSIILSLLPTNLIEKEKEKEIKKKKRNRPSLTKEHEKIEKILIWFHSLFTITKLDEKIHYISEDSILQQIEDKKIGLIQSNIIILIVCKLIGIIARYVGSMDVTGVHVSGSSIENAGFSREIQFISKSKIDKVNSIQNPFCWIEIYCENLKQFIPVEIQSQTIGDSSIFEICRMVKQSSNCIEIKKDNNDKEEEESPKKKSKKKLSNNSKKKTSEYCNHCGCIYYCIALYDNAFFDVSWRYSGNWLHSIRNRMIDPADISWWEETLDCFICENNDSIYEEMKDIDLQDRDEKETVIEIPNTLAAFQKHPLYCLTKNIGKYQEVYPKKAISKFRDQEVFLRSHLHDLHSPEKWLEKGRSIKVDEEEKPIKEVNSIKSSIDTLGVHAQTKLYGRWQTQIFQPLAVSPGEKIPTNQYGNVYLFHSWMIPKGCVHIRTWNSISMYFFIFLNYLILIFYYFSNCSEKITN